MANIYYSYANNRLGALRAVLSPEAGRCLLDALSKRYAGLEFPTGDDSQRDFALLRLFEGEASKEYRPGFYLFDHDLGPVDEALKHLTRGHFVNGRNVESQTPISVGEVLEKSLGVKKKEGRLYGSPVLNGDSGG